MDTHSPPSCTGVVHRVLVRVSYIRKGRHVKRVNYRTLLQSTTVDQQSELILIAHIITKIWSMQRPQNHQIELHAQITLVAINATVDCCWWWMSTLTSLEKALINKLSRKTVVLMLAGPAYHWSKWTEYRRVVKFNFQLAIVILVERISYCKSEVNFRYFGTKLGESMQQLSADLTGIPWIRTSTIAFQQPLHLTYHIWLLN